MLKKNIWTVWVSWKVNSEECILNQLDDWEWAAVSEYGSKHEENSR